MGAGRFRGFRFVPVLVIGVGLIAIAGTYRWRVEHRLSRVVPSVQPQLREDPIVHAARAQIDQGTGYDGRYVQICYPGGDVPLSIGACTDVVTRALRQVGKDLQVLIHEDMKANWSVYPRYGGLNRPDTNIDHRRVPNIRVFMRRHAKVLPLSLSQESRPSFVPGDIVTWKLPMGKDHIGILTDKLDALGWPYVVHNIGRGPQEEDVLGKWELDGHFRFR